MSTKLPAKKVLAVKIPVAAKKIVVKKVIAKKNDHGAYTHTRESHAS